MLTHSHVNSYFHAIHTKRYIKTYTRVKEEPNHFKHVEQFNHTKAQMILGFISTILHADQHRHGIK